MSQPARAVPPDAATPCSQIARTAKTLAVTGHYRAELGGVRSVASTRTKRSVRLQRRTVGWAVTGAFERFANAVAASQAEREPIVAAVMASPVADQEGAARREAFTASLAIHSGNPASRSIGDSRDAGDGSIASARELAPSLRTVCRRDELAGLILAAPGAASSSTEGTASHSALRAVRRAHGSGAVAANLRGLFDPKILFCGCVECNVKLALVPA
jgi:hypothetical protein